MARRNPAVRVISLAPGPTEILFALGLGDAVVGVSHDSDYPPAALALPRLTVPNGDSAAVDRERLVALGPDLIVADDGYGQSGRSRALVRRMLAARLDRRPHVYGLAPRTVGEILSDVKTVGDATGAQARARELLVELRRRIDRITLCTNGADTIPRVACLDRLDPPRAAGLWVPELVGMAGGYDVLASAGQPSRPTTWDEVAAREPGVLVVLDRAVVAGGAVRRSALPSSAAGRATPIAVRAARVIAVDAALVARPGPRVVDGLELLAGLFHAGRCEAVPPSRPALC